MLAALYTHERDDLRAQTTLNTLVRRYPRTPAALHGQLSLFFLHLDAGRMKAAAEILQTAKPQSREDAFELAAAQILFDLETEASTAARPASVRPGMGSTKPVEAHALTQAENLSSVDVLSYPNPFNPATTIEYRLAAESRVVLKVYDVLGRQVQTLVDGRLPAGVHRALFDASHLPSGTYLYRLEASGQVITNAIQLLK